MYNASEVCKLLSSILLGQATDEHGCAADKVEINVVTPDCDVCTITDIKYHNNKIVIYVQYEDDYGDN